tara:strand:+ start:6861 stop:7967 length:1107 start_codon:yes stop_codon:yes gene_type:complete
MTSQLSKTFNSSIQNIDDIISSINSTHQFEMIGEGQFNNIYTAVIDKNGKKIKENFIIRVSKYPLSTEKEVIARKKESSLMEKIYNDYDDDDYDDEDYNIVPEIFYAFAKVGSLAYEIVERFDMDLYTYLGTNRNIPIPEENLYKVLNEAIEIIKELVELNIYCWDYKPSNFLINIDGLDVRATDLDPFFCLLNSESKSEMDTSIYLSIEIMQVLVLAVQAAGSGKAVQNVVKRIVNENDLCEHIPLIANITSYMMEGKFYDDHSFSDFCKENVDNPLCTHMWKDPIKTFIYYIKRDEQNQLRVLKFIYASCEYIWNLSPKKTELAPANNVSTNILSNNDRLSSRFHNDNINDAKLLIGFHTHNIPAA